MYTEVVPGSELLVSTDNVVVPVVVVEFRVTTVWLRLAVTIVPKGCVWAWRRTIPVKPPLPVSVVVALLEEFWEIVRLVGLALMMKCGGTTATSSWGWGVIEPLVPFTVVMEECWLGSLFV